MVYNFSFYFFRAAFNILFLVYVGLFALSIIALIGGLATLDVNGISDKFRPDRSVKWISGYTLLVGLILGGLWITLSLSYVITRKVPSIESRYI